MSTAAARCPWAQGAPDLAAYHDDEWGRPVRGDAALYERLSLEAFQSGLSWLTILRKRPAFREAFRGFDPAVVAAFDDTDVDRLMGDAGIVRNRAKVDAAIGNARALVAWQARAGDGCLDALVWSFAESRPRPVSVADIPAWTPASKALSAALKREGFGFIGPTTAYAAMQACGVVDDHLRGCGTR